MRAASAWGGFLNVVCPRRSGHPMKGGHIRSWLRICRFGFTQTPVGRFANCPEGMPVLRADAAPDPEVVGVADDQLGPKRQPLFEVLLELS